MLNIKEKIKKVIAELEGKLIEREEIIRLILLVIFAKHHAFLIGEPGVAKTRLLKIVCRIVEDASFWEILMTKETKERHLVGMMAEGNEVDGAADTVLSMIDIDQVKKYVANNNSNVLASILSMFRLEERAIRQASYVESQKLDNMLSHPFVLFDEMFKARDDLLVSCLPMLNERYFTFKGRAIPVPLSSLFSASNELPSGEKIEPFVDRLLVWYEVNRIQDKENFQKYINGEFDTAPDTKTKFSMLELEEVYAESSKVDFPREVSEVYAQLEENIHRGGVRVSNRKFGPDYIVRAMKVSAVLNGRKSIDFSDLFFVKHMSWSNYTEKENLKVIVHDTIFYPPQVVEASYEKALKIFREIEAPYNTELESFISFRVEIPSGEAGNEVIKRTRERIEGYVRILQHECLETFLVLREWHKRVLHIENLARNNILLYKIESRSFNRADMVENIHSSISEWEKRIVNLKTWLGKVRDLYEYDMNRTVLLRRGSSPRKSDVIL